MATPVEMPKLGNTVEECLISRWVKRKGETVSAGELVAEIETDKATFEVNSPVDGTVLETFFDEGALVPVFTNIFVVGEKGENIDEFRPGGEAVPAETHAPEPVAAMSTPTSSAGPAPVVEARAFSPRARRFASEHNFNP